jgi:oxygen-dependent protoporphyrinogen oxidase
MARLAEAVTGFPGLYLVGNAYYGVGLPDLVRQGREVARQAARE